MAALRTTDRISTRGSVLVELALATGLIAFFLWWGVRYAAIGIHYGRQLIARDAEVKHQWVQP